MSRLLGAAVATVCLASPALAMLTPPKATPWGLDRDLARLTRPTATTPPTDFQLTPDTEVILDGKPCAYKDVPANARVVRIEVAADRRTVYRIEFRTGK